MPTLEYRRLVLISWSHHGNTFCRDLLPNHSVPFSFTSAFSARLESSMTVTGDEISILVLFIGSFGGIGHTALGLIKVVDLPVF